MPIRFRCAYCNQLLGIARRKAGTVIECPTCKGQVIVPAADAVADTTRQESGPQVALFEGNDLDFLGTGATEAGQSQTGPPQKAATAAAPPVMAAPLDVPQGEATGPTPLRRPGLVLSPRKVAVLSVLVVLALGLAFGAGVLVGWRLL